MPTLGSALARADIVDILKEQWPEGLEDDLLYGDHPGMALIKQRKNFAGRVIHQPVMYSKGQGRSATFSNAQSNVYGPSIDGFDITIVSNYGVAQLEGLIVDQALLGGDEEVFIDIVDTRCRGAMSTLGDDLSHNFYRDIGGARGQRGSVSGSVTTLSNADDIVFFEVGMKLKGSADDGTTGAVRAGDLTITDVDRDAGTFTATGTITSYADNDYLFVEGDFGNKAAGLNSWVPASAPGATAFFGVDRTSDVERLGGIRFTGTGYEPEEMFIQLQARAKRSGVKISHFLCHPNYYAEVETAMQSRGTVDVASPNAAGIGFTGLNVVSGGNGKGGVALLSDKDCQEGVVWGLTGNAWTWWTLGDAPRKVAEDGLEMERVYNSDAFEIRFVARHNWGCGYPGANVRAAV